MLPIKSNLSSPLYLYHLILLPISSMILRIKKDVQEHFQLVIFFILQLHFLLLLLHLQTPLPPLRPHNNPSNLPLPPPPMSLLFQNSNSIKIVIPMKSSGQHLVSLSLPGLLSLPLPLRPHCLIQYLSSPPVLLLSCSVSRTAVSHREDYLFPSPHPDWTEPPWPTPLRFSSHSSDRYPQGKGSRTIVIREHRGDTGGEEDLLIGEVQQGDEVEGEGGILLSHGGTGGHLREQRLE
jgi:hypothetical protein